MPKVDMVVDTRVPPERVRGALLDFSPRRPEIWPGIYAPIYEVYHVGENYADIREGSEAPGGAITDSGHVEPPSHEHCRAPRHLPDRSNPGRALGSLSAQRLKRLDDRSAA